MKIVQRILAVFALALLSATLVPGARADNWSKKTVVTFDQSIEIPGQILPAGTYTFALVESHSDRNIVRIFQADGTTVVATILAVNNYRLHPTDNTSMKFAERSGDNPEALRAWFYPGDNFGQEFVYPRQRAAELAVAVKEPVPATTADTNDLNTEAIVAVTPEQTDEPIAQTVQPTPEVTPTSAPPATPAPVAQETTPVTVAQNEELPKTGSSIPLIALLGLGFIGAAITLKRFAR
ncbi:MAG TPA: LPXTG cell wall anchor domain-containing protein [Candidatus Acidoferrales bacterium]|jgi:LPXTG-motif cell wall-anchored protein|nr:LPXTG cell wall anchor domain-containing protein [Candidatus Acidoferrales bacterium]